MANKGNEQSRERQQLVGGGGQLLGRATRHSHTGHLLQPKTLLGKDNANMDINLEQRLVQVNSRAPAGTRTATGTGSGNGSGRGRWNRKQIGTKQIEISLSASLSGLSMFAVGIRHYRHSF